jgi:SSS family solute:Na+ symporter
MIYFCSRFLYKNSKYNLEEMNGDLKFSPAIILLILFSYFGILALISWLTSRNSKTGGNQDFFIAGRQSPWYIVAFGMIGASLSGVTFISIPGVVGAGGANQAFAYMQVVLGYVLGYVVIALILLPLYYRLKLTSIYSYLEDRFGTTSYKTGAIFFLISRTIGAAFRLFLVVIVLDMLFQAGGWDIPFVVTTMVTILLIWVYTFRGGLKTIVWTDTLQTLFMLIAVGFTIYHISSALDLSDGGIWTQLEKEGLTQWFYFENGWSDPNNFFKQFLSGMFITIVMTGLDQDMMQKNLSCRNLGDAQKNMFSFSVVLVFVNFLFLLMGGLFFVYMTQKGIDLPTRMVNGEAKEAYDLVFPNLAMGHLPIYIGVVFIIGLVAAAYSSADSALTALTTSVCVDLLGMKTEGEANPEADRKRKLVHVLMSVLLCLVIIAFGMINDRSVITQLFIYAGYTYGPLLGLYSFGLFTKLKIKDNLVVVVAVLAPILTYIINSNSEWLLWGYKFGFELLLLNGLLTFVGLFFIVKRR